MIWLGRILGIIGIVLLGMDAVKWAGDGGMRFTEIGEWWFWLHPDSLQLAQPAIERHVAVWLWDPVLLTVLLWPAAVVFLVLGGVFIAIGRWRRWRRMQT